MTREPTNVCKRRNFAAPCFMSIFITCNWSEESEMKAFLIAVETVHDEGMFAEYRKHVVGTLAPFGEVWLSSMASDNAGLSELTG